MRRKRAAPITLLLLALLTSGMVLWLRAERRQYALNRALIAALVKGDNKQALALVNEGADPNTCYTPTPVPSLQELIKQLWHHSAPPINKSPTAFMMACGADWTEDESSSNAQEHRPDDARLTQAMLMHGATLDTRDEDGWTSLVWAVLVNRPRTARVLLHHGAQIDSHDKNGDTPLMDAVMLDADTEVIRVLLEAGAQVNARDSCGSTPLLEAAQFHDNAGIARLLVEHGAQVNAQDEYGLTPLIYAGRYRRSDVVDLLVEHGASVNETGRDGRTALYWVVWCSSYKYLLRISAATYTDKHHTINENKAIIRQLLVHGANPNQPSKSGETPLQLAQRVGRPDIMALLRHFGAKK